MISVRDVLLSGGGGRKASTGAKKQYSAFFRDSVEKDRRYISQAERPLGAYGRVSDKFVVVNGTVRF